MFSDSILKTGYDQGGTQDRRAARRKMSVTPSYDATSMWALFLYPAQIHA